MNQDDERKRIGGVDRPNLSVVRGPSAISEGGDGGDGDHDDTAKWENVWLERCAGQEGYTYDSKENPILRGNLRSRFDCCLVYALSKRKVASDNRWLRKKARKTPPNGKGTHSVWGILCEYIKLSNIISHVV